MTLVAVVVVVLVAHNLVGNLLLPSSLYVPVNLLVAAALLLLARADGISAEELGLDRSALARGATVGLAAFLVVTAVLLLGAAVPSTRRVFADQRAADLAGPAVAYQALVRIPLGTVVLEEVAFRGVLLAALTRATSTSAAVVWSSAVFGLWHIVPTIEALRTNDVDSRFVGVAAAVVVTAVAGAGFAALRLHSGSLVAPALAHVATNSVALVIAASLLRSGLVSVD